jgi:hypothetical protein
MKNSVKQVDYLAAFVVSFPLIAMLAFLTYKLVLEVWCIAYGLVY